MSHTTNQQDHQAPPDPKVAEALAEMAKALAKLAPKERTVSESATRAASEYREIKATLRTHLEKPIGK